MSFYTPNRESYIATVDFSVSTSAPYQFNAAAGFNPALHDYYVFKLRNVIPATDAKDFYIRTSGDSGAGAYKYAAWFADENNSSSGLVSSGAAGATQIAAFVNIGNADNTEQGVSGTIETVSFGSASSYAKIDYDLWGVDSQSPNHGYANKGWGRRIALAQITSIDFLWSSGNFSSGLMQIYGYRLR